MARLADKFANNLKSERLRRRLSQEALASKARLSVSYIAMLERGQRSPPLETVEGLAKALSLPFLPAGERAGKGGPRPQGLSGRRASRSRGRGP